MKEISNLHVLNHPLLTAKINEMRGKDVCADDFRRSMEAASVLLGYEAGRDIPLLKRHIVTPSGECDGMVMDERKVMLVPVLRGGLGMIDPLLRLYCCAQVGGLGIYHNPRTLSPEVYLHDFRESLENFMVLLLDPVVATGRTASIAVDCVKSHGAKWIKCLHLVGTPEGMEYLCSNHPDVEVFLAQMDDGINVQGMVVPGIGDAEDRVFSTGF